MTFEIAFGGDVIMCSKECSIVRPRGPAAFRRATRRRICPPRLPKSASSEAENAALRGGHFAVEPADGLVRTRAEQFLAGVLRRRAPAARAAARCRRASFRNAARATCRRPSSAQSRRRGDRRCRLRRCESSVRSTMSKKRWSLRRSPARQRYSSIWHCGNFGAPRRPPLTGSIMRASDAAA